MNVFKDLFAGVRNIVGGRSEAAEVTYQSLLTLNEMLGLPQMVNIETGLPKTGI